MRSNLNMKLVAKGFFLTYPHHFGTKEDLAAFLATKAPIECYFICREHHADGEPHLHAYVKFKI